MHYQSQLPGNFSTALRLKNCRKARRKALNMRYKALFVILSLFLVRVVFADEVNETIAISCDSLSEEMKVKAIFVNWAHMEMNEIPVGYNLSSRSCKFLNDTQAKVELHEGDASVRGPCGANPSIELQITSADGKLFKFEFSPRCGGLLIQSAVIHRDHVNVCKYTELNHKAPWVPDKFATEPSYECEIY
ncbi:hypothetical protein [Halopseudomonas salegens]|uniref:Uncharacterized protein n=1 Tax=Halopseudomonas salegens TaxID=1434072 RepID=A0A1H2GPF4_9GAMM|nr:hypothetical protein [Halopseudomonas salegens]SDU21359.1 hypothetical protein SAMN05216210_2449 [Halopseudomonas salegens]